MIKLKFEKIMIKLQAHKPASPNVPGVEALPAHLSSDLKLIS